MGSAESLLCHQPGGASSAVGRSGNRALVLIHKNTDRVIKGVTGRCCQAQLFYVCWGWELRSSCFHRDHYPLEHFLSPFFKKKYCVCVCARTYVHKYVIILCPISFQYGLTEPGARMAASKPRDPFVHYPIRLTSTGIIDVCMAMSGFLCGCWGFEFRCSSLLSKSS